MNGKPSKALIGLFVIGAVVLTVAGIVIFGSGRYFSRQPVYVMYFQGSVRGLAIGSPVMFRGVGIGSVTEISIRFLPDASSVRIPVLIQLEPETFTDVMGARSQQEYIKSLIDKGLKAQLQLQNILTSQLYISLDFYPDRPARFMGIDKRHVEIPTMPSSLEQITKTIEKLPLEELANKLISTLEGIEETVQSTELQETIRSMNLAIGDIRKLVQKIDTRVEPVSSEVTSTLARTRKTMEDIDARLASLLASAERTSEATRSAMAGADKAFGAIEGLSQGESSIAYQLGETLDEVSAAARSMRSLAEYLERHPEAIVRGKGSPERR